MKIIFDKILVYSKEPTLMAHFLTYLFDVEVFKTDVNSYDFNLGGTPFRILNSKSCEVVDTPPFQFVLESVEDFSVIKQKLEFFNYTQKTDLKINLDSSQSLELKDPDNRIWKFNLSNKSNFSAEISKNESGISENNFLM